MKNHWLKNFKIRKTLNEIEVYISGSKSVNAYSSPQKLSLFLEWENTSGIDWSLESVNMYHAGKLIWTQNFKVIMQTGDVVKFDFTKVVVGLDGMGKTLDCYL